jgi:DNA-binding NtrC family response regulator
VVLPALAIGLGAALGAAGLREAAAPAVAVLEWRLQSGWLAGRPATPGPRLLVVRRDPEAEARFGRGAWDRAVPARVLGALARGGASAIALGVAAERPSPPGRGGAASDALLVEAVEQAGNVVLPASGEAASLLEGRARGVGHRLAPPAAEGLARRVPLRAAQGGRELPALGLALAALARGREAGELARALPADPRGLVLLPPPAGAPIDELTFSRLWALVEADEAAALRRLVEGRPVALLVDPPEAALAEEATGARALQAQLELAAGILAGLLPREVPAGLVWAAAAALGALSAALLLGLGGGIALAAVLALAGAVAGATLVVLPAAGLVTPAGLPLGALLLAVPAALAWSALAASRRIRQLEGEMGRVQQELASTRGALVGQETTVESLEEDLEAARQAVARATGAGEELGRAAEALRAQLAAAREREERTRRRLAELEAELVRLAEAERPAPAPAGAEPEGPAARWAALGIVTRDPGLLRVLGDLDRAARSSLPILLLGEPGTGKELFARAAHRLSPRAGGPFVAVSMAAVPRELFESELFGHLRGSFTGATADRPGHFATAHGGTLFLDEIGELGPEQQAKLLRVLQEGSFHRVGASRPTAVDVRIVAATNRDLERGVAEGWFRGDLYFRLKGAVLRLPPLRDRPLDLPLLAARLAGQAAAEQGRDGVELSADALAALIAHSWPGNVRELQQCLRQAVALCEGPVLRRRDLRLEPLPSGRPRPAGPGAGPAPDPDGDAAVLERLRRHGFDMQATARELGWDRSTVTQRLKGMGFRALVEAEGDLASAARDLAGDPELAPVLETKLREYWTHLLRTIAGLSSADEAVAACRRRFKNLPERHFRSLERLVRRQYDRR